MHRLLLTFCLFLAGVFGSRADELVIFQPCEQIGLQRDTSAKYSYSIIGHRAKRTVELCLSEAAGNCLPLKIYKFDIDCKGQRVAWSTVAKRMAQHGKIKLFSQDFQKFILSNVKQNIFIYYGNSSDEPVENAKFHVRLPAGYAPLAEMGARIQQVQKFDRTNFDIVSSAQASEDVGDVDIKDKITLPQRLFNKFAQFVFPAGTLEPNEQSVSALEGMKTFNASQLDTLPPTTNVERVNDARVATASQVSAANAWPTAVARGVGTGASTNQSVQQSMIATILGLALITSLVSGIGWFATQRIMALRARQSDPYQLILRREFTDLERPDAQMCSELIRTSQELVEEIHARTNEIKGATPLRRVLIREVNSMEQFLITTLKTSPENPREWRRMRLRLQRVVTDLIRLKDIADVARRSLSTTRTVTDELPRDKQEAYEILGANPEASERILKRLVDALRATWHPDLATSEDDRAMRNLRIQQINVAWDMITEKRID